MVPWNKGLSKQRDLEWEMRELRKADAAAALSKLTPHEVSELHKAAAAAALGENPLPGDDPPKPAKTWDVRIGSYRGNCGATLLFSFPGDIKKKLPASVKIERLDEENWKFSPGPGPKLTPYSGSRVKLSHYDPKAGLFGSSPGEAIESDDGVLVCCPLATRVELVKRTPRPTLAPFRSPPVMPTPAPTPMRTLSLEAGMREVLREIGDIEAACPYRLTRLDDGRIVWRAPVIE